MHFRGWMMQQHFAICINTGGEIRETSKREDPPLIPGEPRRFLLNRSAAAFSVGQYLLHAPYLPVFEHHLYAVRVRRALRQKPRHNALRKFSGALVGLQHYAHMRAYLYVRPRPSVHEYSSFVPATAAPDNYYNAAGALDVWLNCKTNSEFAEVNASAASAFARYNG